MKKIITLALLAFTITLSAVTQDILNNFMIVNNEIIWKKEYQTSLTFQQLQLKVKESGLFKNMEISDKIYCDTKHIFPDCKGAGFSSFQVNYDVSNSYYTAFVIITFKEGSYTVTLKNFEITQQYEDNTIKHGDKSDLERIALNGNAFVNNFKGNFSVILNYTFSKDFDFNK